MTPDTFSESLARGTAALSTFALTLVDTGPWTLHGWLLFGIAAYFANNLCNALFGRTVTFPIRVSPRDEDNYELGRVFSGGYSVALWLMLVIAARTGGA